VAHHKICIVINPQTGAEISIGEHTPCPNIERRRDGEASGNIINSTFSIPKEGWDAARNAVVNNTCLPVRVSASTLNAYHIILEKNRSRLPKEQADLD
jgi:hypothetical protein